MAKTCFTAWFFMVIITSAPAQQNSSLLRAFPITSYMVDLNDSTRLVQLEMPEGHPIQYKQLALVQGIYRQSTADTVSKGYARCYLIKGNYYYFAVSGNHSGRPLEEGDLLYTFMPRTSVYHGLITSLSAHFIQLQDVYGTRFYDRYTVFIRWTESEENNLLDSMVKDIQFTGRYFAANEPDADRTIPRGLYEQQKVFAVMSACTLTDLQHFLEYILDRPRIYAGKGWKLSEVFATWLSEGAPEVIKD